MYYTIRLMTIGVIFLCGTPGILHFRVRTTLHHHLLSISLSVNHLSGSTLPCQFCLPWTLLQEDYPFEALLELNYCVTQEYNLIHCHLSNDRDRLFPCRYLIVHFSPSLFLHPKQDVRVFVFIFRVSSSHRRTL